MSGHADQVGNMLLDSLKMNLFMNFRTGNYIIDTFFTTIVVGFITYFINVIMTSRRGIYNLIPVQETIDYWLSRNRIIIEGRSSLKSNHFTTRSEQLFSNRFRAIWYHINKNINNNTNIRTIKEYAHNVNGRDQYDEPYDAESNSQRADFKKFDMYVVFQNRRFELGNNVWCRVSFNEESFDTGPKTVSKIEVIRINIYSNKLSLFELQNFIDKITENYLENIYNCRWNKKYIYTLDRSGGSEERSSLSAWNECVFKSTRSFDNLFFDDKEELLKKIDFFENNKDWYDKEGHPYTLGIGLHGPPGTGKTSVIKCIANKLNRHLIVIPLDKIKTQAEFSNYYFETKYNKNNKDNSITFDKKIVVLDDIDCMSNIVYQRKNIEKKEPEIESNDISNKDLMKALVKGMQNKDEEDFSTFSNKIIDSKGEDKLTLSFILNAIDGIRETPGRILIITSNFYSKLDKALKRPGRIDYSLEMKNASVKTICSMFYHYYDKHIPKTFVDTYLKNDVISPAKIVNLRLGCDSSDQFLDKLKIIMQHQ